MKELKSGIICADNYAARGRYKVEKHLPRLREDIKNLVDTQSQTDPSFKSQRLYTRLSAAEVRQQLIDKYSYRDEELPTSETIRLKLNDLGYRLKRVAKVQPQKKFPKLMQSSLQVARVNQEASDDTTILRLSLDAKARVNIGSFDRGGKTRVPTEADDHDYKPKTTVAHELYL